MSTLLSGRRTVTDVSVFRKGRNAAFRGGYCRTGTIADLNVHMGAGVTWSKEVRDPIAVPAVLRPELGEGGQCGRRTEGAARGRATTAAAVWHLGA